MPETSEDLFERTLFPNEDIPGIVQDILDACANLTRKGNRDKEVDLTKRVYASLLGMKRYKDGPLEPHLEHPHFQPDGKGGLVETGRTDIRFSCGKGWKTYFIVEAKRLFITIARRRESLLDKYIDEGMCRFVSGKYAVSQQRAAMLGYVFDEALPAVKDKLASAIGGKAPQLQLAPGAGLSQTSLSVRPPVDETLHALPGRPFTIYHILVKV